MNSTDPLSFTCELSNILVLQVLLPNDVHEHISLGDDSDIHTFVDLPAGFKVESLKITVIDAFTRNFSLTLSIEHASLLDGREIACNDTLNKKVTAGCPACGKFDPSE